jgi:hypothetical protein
LLVGGENYKQIINNFFNFNFYFCFFLVGGVKKYIIVNINTFYIFPVGGVGVAVGGEKN